MLLKAWNQSHYFINTVLKLRTKDVVTAVLTEGDNILQLFVIPCARLFPNRLLAVRCSVLLIVHFHIREVPKTMNGLI
jgi:hypothetical protein